MIIHRSTAGLGVSVQSSSKVDTHTTQLVRLQMERPLLPFRYENCAAGSDAPRTGRVWAQYQALSNRSLEVSETSSSTTGAAVSTSTSRKSAYAIAESTSSDPRDTHGTVFRLRSQNAQRNRALNRAGQFWDKHAARLAPMVAKYSLHGRTSGWLAMLVTPPVEEKHLREALEQFMSHLLRVTKQTWPLAAWAPFKDKEGAHLGKQYFRLLPGGKRDLSTKITMSMTMYSSTLQRFTMSARADLLDIVQHALWPEDTKGGQTQTSSQRSEPPSSHAESEIRNPVE